MHAALAHWLPARLLGIVMILAGTAVLVHAFARFVAEGIGTPAPIAPPVHLVVGGPYRYVRNPMYQLEHHNPSIRLTRETPAHRRCD
jgi:protein-S-isoprenylcysteine O-methyltransferase Ste14